MDLLEVFFIIGKVRCLFFPIYLKVAQVSLWRVELVELYPHTDNMDIVLLSSHSGPLEILVSSRMLTTS